MGQAEPENFDPWVPQQPSDRTFGGRLKLIRLHLDISQREAAGRCGVKRATWSAWERNPERSPRNVNDIAQQVHDHLGVDLHWLAFGPESLNVRVPHAQGRLLLADDGPAFDFAASVLGLVGIAS